MGKIQITMSHEQGILKHLKRGGSLTHLDALSLFGCARLAARVHDLRRQGVPVKEIRVTHNKKRFSKYFLEMKDWEPKPEIAKQKFAIKEKIKYF